MNYASQLVMSAVVGVLAVAPFFVLEWFTTSGYPLGAPWAVFIALWIQATVGVALLTSVMRGLRTPDASRRWPWAALKLTLALPCGLAFVYLVIDQMPCFLGGRGC